MKKIILLGYMGSGKSETARALHQKTGLAVIDLDISIEEETQMSIPDIFRKKGEIYFRKVEHRVFSALMKNTDEFILSLGGGTPCYAGNHLLLNGENVISIYLKASPETLYERLKTESDVRPLLAGKDPSEMQEFIAKHLFDRSFYYNHATYKIGTDGKTPAQVSAEIIDKIKF